MIITSSYFGRELGISKIDDDDLGGSVGKMSRSYNSSIAS
jgi:hypothetical protein